MKTIDGHRRGEAWLHDRRGVAAVECALGIAVMLTATFTTLNLYRQARAQATVTHVAVALADYVSRDKMLMEECIESLAEFLHVEQLAPSAAAFVVSVIEGGEPGEAPSVLWTLEPMLFSADENGDSTFADDCSRVGGEGEPANLPDGFTLASNEAVVVAEICIEHTNPLNDRVMYAHHILPPRGDTPGEPS